MSVARADERTLYSLLVQGDFSRRNGEALLSSHPADGSSWLVFYFDTEPSPGSAGAASRSESYELLDVADRLEIDRFAMDVLYAWPSADETRLGKGLPLRDHCIDGDLQKRLITYLQNLKIAEQLFERYAIHRIQLGKGAGISALAWEQFAMRRGLPLQHLEPDRALEGDPLMPLLSLPPEVVSCSSPRAVKKRGIGKIFRAWGSQQELMRIPRSARGSHLVLCSSRRIDQLYAKEIAEANRRSDTRILPVYVDPFGSILGGIGSQARRAYRERWLEFSTAVGTLQARPRSYRGQDLGEWLLKNLEGHFRHRYPQAQQTLKRAVSVLGRVRPAALLTDTQPGSAEGLWGLAARSLEIPVYSYTFDPWPHRRMAWSPDYLLVDSVYARRQMLRGGFSERQLIDVRSHRQPEASKPNSEWIRAIRARWAIPSSGTIVLCADGFFAGSTALQHPAESYRFYRALCLQAGRDPDTTFLIKFHPFRSRRKTKLGSMAFDQAAVDRRRAFLRELSPPANIKLLTVDTPVEPLLGLVDLVVNIESAVGLEAMVARVPVLYFNYQAYLDWRFPGLDAFGACNSTDDVEAFADLMGRFLSNPRLREELVRRQTRYLEECFWKEQTGMIESLVRHLGRADRAARSPDETLIPSRTLGGL